MTNQEYVNEVLGENIPLTIKEDTDVFTFGKDIKIKGKVKLLLFDFYVKEKKIVLRSPTTIEVNNKKFYSILEKEKTFYINTKEDLEKVIQFLEKEININIEKLIEQKQEYNKTMEKTFGMRSVGIDFNPSGDERVYKAKKLCADLIDMIEEKRESDLKQVSSDLNTKESEMFRWSSAVFRTAAFNAIIAAQMQIVKFLTWKDK